MSAESGVLGAAVGIAVGVLAWVVGLGELVWAEHPDWVLVLIIIPAAIVSAVMLERNERRSTRRAHI